MTLVRFIYSFDGEQLKFGTPGCSGVWQGITFTEEPVNDCDYVIVFNKIPENTIVNCPQENIWLIMQEPPLKFLNWFQKAYKHFHRVYTPDINLQGNNIVHSHGMLPWYINKDYDFLINCPVPDKSKLLSWVTSNLTFTLGHKQRMIFLEKIQNVIEFDLWGKGFNPIDDKWDGVAPYRYSLAIENYSGLYYWTEKIADCFLSYTMPIYYGCTNISDYFPQESYIWIDINKPEEAREIIKETINSDLWIRNRDAIIYARELVLNKYQIYPIISKLIQEHEKEKKIRKIAKIYLPKTEPDFLILSYFLEIAMKLGRQTLPLPVRDWLWHKIAYFIYN